MWSAVRMRLFRLAASVQRDSPAAPGRGFHAPGGAGGWRGAGGGRRGAGSRPVPAERLGVPGVGHAPRSSSFSSWIPPF